MEFLWVVLTISLWASADGAVTFEQRSKAPTYANPDSHGYRFCASWVLADGTPIYSGCDPFSVQRCGQELKFDYKCCSGFEHSHQSLGGASSNPCAKLIPQFDDCPSVVEALGYKTFASYLRQMTELTRKNGSPFTIFVPMPADGEELKQIYGGSSREVGYHVVKGRIYAEQLRNGVKLESIYNNEEIEISRNSYGSVNVECIDLSQADIECQSGLIHIIRRPLVPRKGLKGWDKSSVMSLLRTNTETRDFGDDLPEQMKRDLADVNSGTKYTVTAPTSRSWSSAKSGKSRAQIEKMAASHVTKGLKCSSRIIKDAQTFTDLMGEGFQVKCETENRNEVRSIIDACGDSHRFVAKQSDMMAANGVVHMLDSPIIPSSALTLKDFMSKPECAKYQNIDKFVDDLKKCDLYMEDGEKYALIAPENEAFTWWKNYPQFRKEYELYQTDAEYRCRVARYHIVKNDGNLFDIPRFSGHTDGHRSNNKKNYLYETTYITKDNMGSKLYYHYSPVNNMKAVPLEDTSIYRTGRINVIPEMNITDVVGGRTDLSHSNNIMKISDMNNKYFKKDAPKNLFLVPTNDGWIDKRSKELGKNLISPELARYEMSAETAEMFAKLHHIPLYLWGGDIGYFPKNSVHKFMSSADVELIFWNDDKGVMRIGYDGLDKSEWPKVVQFNQHARDGMVWTLDGFMKCPEHLCPFQLEDTDIYTFFTAACLTTDLPGEVDVKNQFAKTPTDIAKRHPDQCIVIKQGEVKTTKDLFEEGGQPEHDH